VFIQVKADIHSLELVRQTYTLPDHSMFLLVPQEFFKQAAAFMKELNHAEITHDNIWDMCYELG
jgi:hypothetical protein